jgi:hypothetical protein
MTKKYPEGMEITLPVKYKHLTVKRLPKGNPQPGKVGRIVMNFEFRDPASKKKHKKKFTKPIKMRVYYNAKDEKRAGEGKNLKLRYDRGSGWQTFKNVKMKHYGKGKGGYGEVEFTDWDPGVGWFP